MKKDHENKVVSWGVGSRSDIPQPVREELSRVQLTGQSKTPDTETIEPMSDDIGFTTISTASNPVGRPMPPFTVYWDEAAGAYKIVQPVVYAWNTSKGVWSKVKVSNGDLTFGDSDSVYLKLTNKEQSDGSKFLEGEITKEAFGDVPCIADISKLEQYVSGALVLYGHGSVLKGNTTDSVEISGSIEITTGEDSNVKVKTYYDGDTPKLSIDVYYL